MTLYFAYGANMERAAMRKRCPAAQPLGPAALRGWRYVIAQGYGSVAPAPGLLSAKIERIDDLGRIRFARTRLGDAKLAARAPAGFTGADGTAGLKFDPSHVHVYADSILVEGAA